MSRLKLLTKVAVVVVAASLMAVYLVIQVTAQNPDPTSAGSKEGRPAEPVALADSGSATLPLFANQSSQSIMVRPAAIVFGLEPSPPPRFVRNGWTLSGLPPEVARQGDDFDSPKPGIMAPPPPRYVYPQEFQLKGYRPRMLKVTSKSGAPAVSPPMLQQQLQPSTRPAGR